MLCVMIMMQSIRCEIGLISQQIDNILVDILISLFVLDFFFSQLHSKFSKTFDISLKGEKF